MKILHISAGNLFGGVETLLLTLARRRGVCPGMTPHFAYCFEGRLASELRSTGVCTLALGKVRFRKPWSIWRARRLLARHLYTQRFDAVVCHSVWSQSLFGPVVRIAEVPLFFWLHDVARGKHWLERWTRRTRPDAAICNSRFTAEGLSNLYRGVPAAVVHCPVAAPEAAYSDLDRRSVRDELQTPRDAIVVVQVSRLEPYKGHALLFEALGRMIDLPDWVCWQVGGVQRDQEAAYLERLKRQAMQLGIADRVRFLNQRSDVPRLLAAADIFCQPNEGPEPFGITFIEALWAGIPVVTTNLGGAKEIVDASCGELVPPGNADALGASLRRQILDSALRNRLGAAGPRRARQLCDPQQQLALLYNFLHRESKRELAA